MYKVLDGNKNCSNSAYNMVDYACIYPITPSSPMAENIDYLARNNQKNIFNDTVKIVEMNSESGAIGALHGAMLTGSLATTFTSSQGLLLMIPNMYKIAGECLPAVMHVASRTVATHALSIFGDHSDIYATRQTGWCMLSSSNVHDTGLLSYVAHLSAIKGSLPFIHFFDGFRTSHEINKVETLDIEEVKKLVDYDAINKFRKNMLLSNKKQRGMAENEDIYFQSLEARNPLYNQIPDIVNDYMKSINKLAHTDYKPFNYYGDPSAKNIIVAMGSVCDTIKLVVDDLNKRKKHVGLIEVHLYRPFSTKYLKNVLPDTVKNIAVLDRTKESGSVGEPLYLDVLASLSDTKIKVVGGRYGISSKNTTPGHIATVFEMLETKPRNNFTIGIDDDVTNLSLSPIEYKIDINCDEIKIYGFASDGMVSASKDIMDILGTDNFVQNYNQYDSRKSGGITICNLRISKLEINAPYYLTNPNLVVVNKDSYFEKYNMLEDINDNGTLLINTNKKINDILSNNDKQIISNKNIKVYTIDADQIALNNNIKGKTSKIMETIILKLLNIKESEKLVIDSLSKKLKDKGESIIQSNVKSIEEAINNLKLEDNKFTSNKESKEDYSTIDLINKRLGDNISVSEISKYRDGAFECNLAVKEMRKASELVPKVDLSKCVQCNMCSLVCPHGVIRPYIHSKDEGGIPIINDKEHNFSIKILESICTSCGLCINNCKTKALSFGKYDDELNKEAFEWLNKPNNNTTGQYTPKGSQFEKPRIINPGACAGCGETPYLKLLTQLFRDKLLIANATGCSSIYGGSAPSTPYDIPWANSLFEDNAEFGYGMLLSYTNLRNRLINYVNDNINTFNKELKELLTTWLNNINNYDETVKIKEKLLTMELPKELENQIDYIVQRTIWTIGGDGWAYDIGFGGLDHVLSSNENVNVLVLDTEVYSNTGGQSSKSTNVGGVAGFASSGKKTIKKDLFKIAMCYPNCYVASISFGANFAQTIKAMKEASEHNGPSIIIAYAPCIEHGIKNGMSNSISEEKLVVESGYSILMRYNPTNEILSIDSPTPNFDKYEELLNNETRYINLKNNNQEEAEKLLKMNKENAIKRYNYYLNISNKG